MVRKVLPPGIHETSWSYAPDTDGPIQPGFALFGREISLEAAVDMGSLSQAVVEAASTLKPVFEAIQALGPGQPGTERAPPGHEPTFSPGDLRVLADEFRADHHYPTPRNERHEADRALWAERLRSEGLPALDYETFRHLYYSSVYGRPGHSRS